MKIKIIKNRYGRFEVTEVGVENGIPYVCKLKTFRNRKKAEEFKKKIPTDEEVEKMILEIMKDGKGYTINQITRAVRKKMKEKLK